VGQVITMNRLLASFPTPAPGGAPVGGPFTVVIGSMLMMTFLYVLVLIGVLVARPSARRYFRHVVFSPSTLPNHGTLKAWCALGVYSVCSACNGIFLAYGARNTPELIQSVVLSTQLVFLVVFSAAFKLGGGRSYLSLMVLVALVLSMLGIGVGTAGDASSLKGDRKTVGWVFILLAGVISIAACGVSIAVFFRFAVPDLSSAAAAAAAAAVAGSESAGYGAVAADPAVVATAAAAAAAAVIVMPPTPYETPREADAYEEERGITYIDGTRAPLRIGDLPANTPTSNPRFAESMGGGSSTAGDPALAFARAVAQYNQGGAHSQSSASAGAHVTTSLSGPGRGGRRRSSVGQAAALTPEQAAEQAAVLAAAANANELIDPIAANLWMLVFGNGLMVAACFIFFPLDWAPFFGTNDTAAQSHTALANGMQCLFDRYPGCDQTFGDFAAFVVDMAVMTASMTIMSRISPPLSGMLMQVASPLSAIVLVIFPRLNANPSPTKVGDDIGALLLIATGAVVFAMWERLGEAPVPHALEAGVGAVGVVVRDGEGDQAPLLENGDKNNYHAVNV
jgi:hypothetical protein